MMKNNVKKRKRFRFSKLLKNTQFALVCSLLISITIWIVFNLSDGNETSMTIVNIPVNVTLSEEAVDDGLKIFSGNEQFASVTVKGNRVALGNIKSEDILITADGAGSITNTGTYPLSLIATKATSTDNFEILSSVSPSVITVFVDYADKQKFEITNNLIYNVEDGYYAKVALSSNDVIIQGPKSELQKIAKVSIEGNIKNSLKENREMECEIKLYDHSGSLYNNNLLNLNIENVKAVFSVTPEKKVPVKIKYKNSPTDFDVDKYVKISQNEISISGPEDILANTDAIYTETVDFRDLKNQKKTLELKFDIPENCINLSDIDTIEGTFDFRTLGKINVAASDFSVINLPSNFSYDITTESLSVDIIGTKEQLDNIDKSDVSCVINASDFKGKTGLLTIPVKATLKNSNYCWVYGYYEVNISVSAY